MTSRSEILFSEERDDAVRALQAVASGAGWCNVTPVVDEDVPDLKVNTFGLWVNKGVAVATLVTMAPRHGVAVPSTLGVLHTRGRLGRERIAQMLGEATFAVKQDHNARGLLLEVPADADPREVLNLMCMFTERLCDYEVTRRWRLDQFLRP